jgi:hypothetical protein
VFNPERWLKCAAGAALRLELQDGPGQDGAFINALYAETSIFAGQNRESEIKKWEENQKELERFAAALPEIAKQAHLSGELHLPGIGKLKVKVKVLSGSGVKLICEPIG